MTRWSLLILAACGGQPASPPAFSTTPNPTPPVATSTVTRESAERALHDDAPLDFERPFNGKPYDRARTIELFHARCASGDKQACIVEAQLLDDDATVKANCAAGDVMSCRALPVDENKPRFPDLPGEMSRRAECAQFDKAAACDIAVLRKECTDGFPEACNRLMSSKSQPDDVNELAAQVAKLAMQGCRAGIASECAMIGFSRNETDELRSAERLCDLRRDGCAQLSAIYERAHDSTNARDALERACQYDATSAVGSCMHLGLAYLDGNLKEPVVGRGQALLNWACAKSLERSGGKQSKRTADLCKRAAR